MPCKILARQAHELFERRDFLNARPRRRRAFPRVAVGFQFCQMPDARLEFFVDVAGQTIIFLDDFLLVEKFQEGFLQFGTQLLKFLPPSFPCDPFACASATQNTSRPRLRPSRAPS